MKAEERLTEQFDDMLAELRQWRAEHPEASFDEIAARLAPLRRKLMGEVMNDLALQHGNGYALEGRLCPACGGEMEYKGDPERQVEHLEGDTELARSYYHCPRCSTGSFPPG